MSILIKGMKMPKCCVKCEWHEYYGGDYDWVHACRRTGTMSIENAETERANDCPLVEIPEHGRLIDADAYCEDLLEEAHRVWGLLKPETIERINRTVDDLKNYPAVVEAEGSENHA